MLYDKDQLEKLFEFSLSLIEEVEDNHEDEKLDQIGDTLISSDEFQKNLLATMKTAYRILSPFIDADRMGQLVIEMELDPAIFDEEFGSL